jgi:hypothetical protein
MMTCIWTIQPAQVWQMLRNKQLLYVEDDVKTLGRYIPPAYRWLQIQLASRLAGYSGHLPWWAHFRKPDLRRHRHLLQKGTMQVRLELEIADSAFLRFPCWAWQRVFCEDYLAATREEYENWTKALRCAVPDEDIWPLPEPWRWQLEASWQRLFDPNLRVLDWDDTSAWSRFPCLEGVFEMLRLDDVRRVTSFKGSFTWGKSQGATRRKTPGRPLLQWLSRAQTGQARTLLNESAAAIGGAPAGGGDSSPAW